MDHAINQLREYMQATSEMYQDMGLTKKEVRSEFKAFVDALNSLERHHYGEERTKLESVLNRFPK